MFSSSTEAPQFARFQLSTAAWILGYGILHDQWVAAISPEHFTVYHPQLIQTDSAPLQALALAAVATLGPGLLLGALLWLICRAGKKAIPLPYSFVWPRLISMLAINEVMLAGLSWLSFFRFKAYGEVGLLLPRWLYPEMRVDLVVAQNLQLAAYAAAAVSTAALMLILHRKRHHQMQA